jgi:hypothetical protein
VVIYKFDIKGKIGLYLKYSLIQQADVWFYGKTNELMCCTLLFMNIQLLEDETLLQVRRFTQPFLKEWRFFTEHSSLIPIFGISGFVEKEDEHVFALRIHSDLHTG